MEQAARWAAWGESIRKARGRRSQAWLADEIGVNQTAISQWENGAAISDDRKLQLAAALGLQVGELFPWRKIQDLEPIWTQEVSDVAAL